MGDQRAKHLLQARAMIVGHMIGISPSGLTEAVVERLERMLAREAECMNERERIEARQRMIDIMVNL